MERGDPRAKSDYRYAQAKLKPGVTIQQAQADMEVIARRLAQVYPDDYPRNFKVRAVDFVDDIVGQFSKTLYTIAAAVGLLLLIACSNVANMLLARATAREKEMAIRSAIGAGRMRLVGQLLTESLLLALGGAIVGCLFSYAGIKALVTLIPEDGLIPSEVELRLNLPALLFCLVTAAGSATLFGLAPALQTVRKDLIEPLKDAGPGAGGGFRRGRPRNALVVVEVALSLVLLSGAGLLMRSFVKLQQIDLGFNPENLLINMLESRLDSPVKDPVFEIIGVISDAKNQGIREAPMPEIFLPYTITGAFERGILVRTSTPPLSLLNDVRREIRTLDGNVALALTGSLEDFMKQYFYAAPRFGLVLMVVLASVGLALVALGVFSVIAYTVARQTREIGIRMALGAGHADVVWMVLRRGLRLVGLGMGVGLLASFAVTRVIAKQLWEVSPRDPLTLCAAVIVVALAGLAACYFPARRATRGDPLVALRVE